MREKKTRWKREEEKTCYVTKIALALGTKAAKIFDDTAPPFPNMNK